MVSNALIGGLFGEQSFSESFSSEFDNFSYGKLGLSMGVGALSGLGANYFLHSLGVPTKVIPSLQTAEGATIRATGVVTGASVNQAGRAMIDFSGTQNIPGPVADQSEPVIREVDRVQITIDKYEDRKTGSG